MSARLHADGPAVEIGRALMRGALIEAGRYLFIGIVIVVIVSHAAATLATAGTPPTIAARASIARCTFASITAPAASIWRAPAAD